MRTLYVEAGSPFSLEARWLLAWKRLPHDVVTLDAAAREDLRARCGDEPPPILRDGEDWVAGPRAIAFHLERRHPERPFFPEEPRKRNQAVTFAEFAERGLAPLVEAAGADEAAVGELRECLLRVRDAVTRGALGSESPHLGDLALAAHLDACRRLPGIAFEREWPDLVAFLTRVRAWVMAGGAS